MNNNNNIVLKIILLGDSGVGKTCIINRYINNTYVENQQSTINADFEEKKLNINSNEVKIQIWDTAGQEKYRSITEAYYRGSSGAIIVFDITNEASFDAVKTWVQDYKDHQLENFNIILAGNKSDLDERRHITNQAAEEYASSIDVKYFEVSAKSSENIDDLFNTFATDLYNKNAVTKPVHSQDVSVKKTQESRKCCNIF